MATYPLDRASARVQLAVLCAASQRPTLDADALDVALDKARIADSYARWPIDAGYVETFDMDAAAQYGWEIKAGIVAGDFSFTADDASYSKADVLANIERMVQMYAAKRTGTTLASTVLDRRDYDAAGLLP